MLGRLGTSLAGGAIKLHRDLAEKAVAERIAKPSSTLLGALDTGATFLTRPVFGEVSLLIGAVLLVRTLPQGITGTLFKGSI
jgi:hypothetical protein